MRQRLVQLGVVLALLLVWQAIVVAGLVRPSLLPVPRTVAAALVKVLGDRDVVRGLQVTALEVAVTVLLTVPLAVLQGVRIGVVFGITGIILAEMYVTRDGFGRFITLWGTAYQMPELLAGVVILGGAESLINE